MSAQMNDAAKQLAALRAGIAAELVLHPRYKSLIEDLRARRPKVPYWKPAHVITKKGKDGAESMVVVPDNTAEMQAASAQQKWHDVLMAIIDPSAYPKGV